MRIFITIFKFLSMLLLTSLGLVSVSWFSLRFLYAVLAV